MGCAHIQVIADLGSSSPVADGLRLLTSKLNRKHPERRIAGALGGADGYGVAFDCDVFTMRPFYWGDCPRSCPWENSDDDIHAPTCPVGLPNFLHKASGLEVRWYKYIGRSMEMSRAVTTDEWAAIMAECLAEACS